MKVLQINTVCGTGSTGRIVADLYKTLTEEGHDCFVGYGRGNAPQGIKAYRIGTDYDMYHHALMTRISDKTGFYSKKATKKFIKEAKQYNPDIIHLHNLHGYYINLELLFEYLYKANKPIVWTLHDCWAFTGHCAYFDYIGCDKWKKGCYSCPQKNEYPRSVVFDNSKWNYQHKENLFTTLENMTIITPSEWLAGLAKQSFLGKFDIKVINNGIDLTVFKPKKSNFREKYNLEEKFIVLGVANIWDRRKGLDVFFELCEVLNDDYKIILMGLNNRQMENLPENILGLMRTDNVTELIEIYTAADVFVNPALEDNFPTVNLEALACGTPIITYDTGGSVESIDDNCGFIVKRCSVYDLKKLIECAKSGNMFSRECCTSRAKLYDKKNMSERCLEVYKNSNNKCL